MSDSDDDKKSILDYPKADKFKLADYKIEGIEERVNELVELCKKEYPSLDLYLLWVQAVDYVLEEKGLKKDTDEGEKMYNEYLKERQNLIYNSVKLCNEKGDLLENDEIISKLII